MAEIDYIHPEDDPNQGKTPPPNVPAVTPAPVVDESKARAEEQVKRFFSASIPEPKLDEKKLDRINRMGKINQLSKGVGVVGDILGLALGANVRKKAPDTETPRLMQEYQKTLDQYKGQQDIYDVRNFQKIREDAQFGLNRVDRDRADELANARLKASTEEARARANQDWQKFLINAGLSEKKQQALESHYKALENQGQQKIAISKTKADKTATGKPFNMVNLDGKDVPLTQGEHRAALEEAMKTPGWTNQDLKGLLAGYENAPIEAEKNIVQRYLSWKSKQTQQPMIFRPADQVKSAMNPSPANIPATARQPVGTVTGPPKPAKQKPAYSSLNF